MREEGAPPPPKKALGWCNTTVLRYENRQPLAVFKVRLCVVKLDELVGADELVR